MDNLSDEGNKSKRLKANINKLMQTKKVLEPDRYLTG